jgi:uncharacterized protein YegP (UPF0339 family)
VAHEVFEGQDEQHYFRVKSANGEIVSTSEGYTRAHDAERGYGALLRAVQRDSVRELFRIMFTGWKLHEASYDEATREYKRTAEDCMTEAANGDEQLGYVIHLFDHWSNDLQAMAPHFGIALRREVDTENSAMGPITIVDNIEPAPSKDHYWSGGRWNLLVGDQPTKEIAERGQDDVEE